MKSILSEMYVGNVNPSENLHVDNPEYAQVTAEACKLEAQFRDKMDETERLKFDRMVHLITTGLTMEVTQAFVEGFKLGAKILLTILE